MTRVRIRTLMLGLGVVLLARCHGSSTDSFQTTIIGDTTYTFDRETLGEGGIGTVHRGTYDDGESRKTVVGKFAKSDIFSNETEALKNEIIIHKIIKKRIAEKSKIEGDYPNLCLMHSSSDSAGPNGVPVMVLPLLGPSLEDVSKRLNPIPDDILCHIAKQMIECLEQLHTLGMIHRDIKPANVVFEDPIIDPENPNRTLSEIEDNVMQDDAESDDDDALAEIILEYLNKKPKLILIDYGVARSSYKDEGCPDTGADGCGNMTYQSIRSHEAFFGDGIVLSRKDDLEGAGYMMYDLKSGHLPWLDLCFQLAAKHVLEMKRLLRPALLGSDNSENPEFSANKEYLRKFGKFHEPMMEFFAYCWGQDPAISELQEDEKSTSEFPPPAVDYGYLRGLFVSEAEAQATEEADALCRDLLEDTAKALVAAEVEAKPGQEPIGNRRLLTQSVSCLLASVFLLSLIFLGLAIKLYRNRTPTKAKPTGSDIV